MSNPCIRCGNERVPAKTWEEKMVLYGRTTVITQTEYVCTDAECQKTVEKQLQAIKEKREQIENQKEYEKQARAKEKLANSAKAA